MCDLHMGEKASEGELMNFLDNFLSDLVNYYYYYRFCVGDRFYLCDNRILCEYDYEERMVFANMSASGNGAGGPNNNSSSGPMQHSTPNNTLKQARPPHHLMVSYNPSFPLHQSKSC